MSAAFDFLQFAKKLTKFFQDTDNMKIMEALGNEANNIIRKRTRLGYGVVGDKRKSLKSMRSHHPDYTQYRKDNKNKLSSLTRPTKHNLTFSGQLLDSQGIRVLRKGKVTIGPTGYRKDGQPNALISNIVQKRGWVYNSLTIPEQKQITRFYRRTFGDLVKRNLS